MIPPNDCVELGVGITMPDGIVMSRVVMMNRISRVLRACRQFDLSEHNDRDALADLISAELLATTDVTPMKVLEALFGAGEE